MENFEASRRDAVQMQLQRILASSEFQSSQAISRFLTYVVDETLAGRAERLKAYTIAVGAYGRNPDFDPQTDTIVRVHARRLRRALERYYFTDGVDDSLTIELIPGSYVPKFRDRSSASAPEIAGPISQLVITPSFASSPQGPAIMVVPLDALGVPAEELYLADGFTEQIAKALTAHQEIRIIGPLRRQRLAHETRSITDIAAQYDAEFVIQGGLRKSDETIKLTVRLVERTTHRTLWSESYDNRLEPDNWFDFEEKIAARVASTVADQFGVLHRSLTRRLLENRTDSGEAFEAVLRWNHYFSVLTEPAWNRARDALEHAVVSEPSYALTHALLADIYGAQYHLLGAGNETLVRAGELVETALALDSNCHMAHFMQASLYMIQRNRSLFLHKADYVLQTWPHNSAQVGGLALFIGLWGDWERGLALVEQAMGLNPHYPSWYHYLPFMHHYRTGDYERALAETMRFSAPGFYWDVLLRSAVLGQLGRQEEGAAELDRLQDQLPATSVSLRELIKRTVMTSENTDHLLEGLTLTGRPLPITARMQDLAVRGA